MFISKHYKLQGRSSDKALVMTIPANVVQNFGLTKASQLKMTFEDDKLIIDLRSNGGGTRPKILAGAPA
jgi:hypothetical protein